MGCRGMGTVAGGGRWRRVREEKDLYIKKGRGGGFGGESGPSHWGFPSDALSSVFSWDRFNTHTRIIFLQHGVSRGWTGHIS